MGSLGLNADPDGWLNAGYTINALMDSLESELYDADRVGGSGLTAHWAGPVADAFNGHWGALHPRVADLIVQGRRAASAISQFGGKLEDFVARAGDLERYWLGFGLHLEGMFFTLPLGFELLSPEHQLSFRQLVTESERDVTAMWDDIKAAVDDVVTVLESLIDAFEDFAVLELGAAAGLFGGYLGGYLKDPVSLVSDGLSVALPYLVRSTNHGLDEAYRVAVSAGEDAGRDVQAVADATAKSAVRNADLVHDVGKFGGPVLLLATVGVTAWQTYDTAKTAGWVNAIEDHAGDWAGLAAGIGIGVAVAAAPVAVPAIAVVVGGGIVAAGVGSLVQWGVDDHRKVVGQALTDIGHGADITAKTVGHGLDDATEWVAEHREDLSGPALTPPLRSWLTK